MQCLLKTSNLGKLVLLLLFNDCYLYVFVIDRYAEAKGLGVQVNETRDAISKSLLSIPII